jgi:hypothetical protein
VFFLIFKIWVFTIPILHPIKSAFPIQIWDMSGWTWIHLPFLCKIRWVYFFWLSPPI